MDEEVLGRIDDGSSLSAITSSPPSPFLSSLTSQQQHLLAELCYALGLSSTEISAATGLSLSHLSILESSPLFLGEIDRIRQRFSSQLVQSAISKLQSEALASIDRLVEFRDNPMLNVRERRLSAETLLDRLPETSKSHHIKHEHTANHSLSDKQFDMLLKYINGDSVAQEAFAKNTIDITPQDYAIVDEATVASLFASTLNASSLPNAKEDKVINSTEEESTYSTEIKEKLSDFLSIQPDQPESE